MKTLKVYTKAEESSGHPLTPSWTLKSEDDIPWF